MNKTALFLSGMHESVAKGSGKLFGTAAAVGLGVAAAWTVRQLYERVEVAPTVPLLDALTGCTMRLHLRTLVMSKARVKEVLEVVDHKLYRVRTDTWSGFVTRDTKIARDGEQHQLLTEDMLLDSTRSGRNNRRRGVGITDSTRSAYQQDPAHSRSVLVFYVRRKYLPALHTFIKQLSAKKPVPQVIVRDPALADALVDYVFRHTPDGSRTDFRFLFEQDQCRRDLLNDTEYEFPLPDTGLVAVAMRVMDSAFQKMLVSYARTKTTDSDDSTIVVTLANPGPDMTTEACVQVLTQGLTKIRNNRGRGDGDDSDMDAMLNVYRSGDYNYSASYWVLQTERTTARPLHTLAYPGTLMQDLVRDIGRFLGSGALARYKAVGVPHRRGYLLHGPPGTGKTSAIRSILRHFGLGAAVLDNIKKLSDSAMAALMMSVPDDTAIVIEDVDLMFDGCGGTDDDAGAAAAADFSGSGSGSGSSSRQLTLSGFFNALDGICVGKSRLVFMTTNDFKKLAPALLRAGRCDYHVYLGPLQRDQITTMARLFFDHQHDDMDALHEALTPYLGTLVPATLQNLFLDADSLSEAVAKVPAFFAQATAAATATATSFL